MLKLAERKRKKEAEATAAASAEEATAKRRRSEAAGGGAPGRGCEVCGGGPVDGTLERCFKEARAVAMVRAFQKAGESNGRPLFLQVMCLPPRTWSKVHAHPSIQLAYVLAPAAAPFLAWYWHWPGCDMPPPHWPELGCPPRSPA